ncbi:MAG: hypothetical protein Tsb002_04020 [Wenzhouxiangellaceae bacterium]
MAGERVSFRHYRIYLLLLILLLVGWDAWLDRSELTAWEHPLRVVVYPLNGDGSQAAASYVERLRNSSFKSIERVMSAQAAAYGLALDLPLSIELGPPVDELPPQPPVQGNVLQIMWWNLKVRRWAGAIERKAGLPADIRVFMQFYDHHANGYLAHSVGVEKGRIAIAHLYATRAMAAENDMILLHEILHTLGASDKYDPATNQPLYPQGFAQPQKQPLYPQAQIEIMAGRRPLSATEVAVIDHLDQLVIGEQTAREIGWLKGES